MELKWAADDLKALARVYWDFGIRSVRLVRSMIWSSLVAPNVQYVHFQLCAERQAQAFHLADIGVEDHIGIAAGGVGLQRLTR